MTKLLPPNVAGILATPTHTPNCTQICGLRVESPIDIHQHGRTADKFDCNDNEKGQNDRS